MSFSAIPTARYARHVRGTLRSLQDPNDGTKSVATIDVDAYDAILVVGGQAPMFAFDSASTLHTKFVEFSRQTDFYSLLAVTMRSPEIPQSADLHGYADR